MAAALVVVVFLVAFTVDTAIHSGQVTRNVELSGTAVGGLSEDDLLAVVEEKETALAATEVVIVTPSDELTTTAGEAGVGIDRAATVDTVLDVGRDGSVLTRPFSWLGSLFSSTDVHPIVTVADDVTDTSLASITSERLSEPVEPELVFADGAFAVQAGVPGSAIDAASVLAQLAEVVDAGTNPIVLQVEPVPVAPATPDSAIAAIADDINSATARGIEVTVDGRTETIGTADLRSWVSTDFGEDGGFVGWTVDPEAAQAFVEAVFTDAGEPGELGEVTVIDGVPTAAGGGTPGTRCCSPEAGAQVADAVTGGRGSVTLELTEDESVNQELLEEMGVIELIGEFTTEHAAGQSRVENIHRIADIVRGAMIEPDGGRWTINDFVGRRTIEKGFVSAGVIENGVFVEDVGGGISQFATTIFNAAFFGGLDFGEYQAHSIYISRYPYGREATVSFPAPDLELINNTPHHVMIWTSYTDTSITVQLYSTRYADVVETGQSSQAQGQCTRVYTYRERTYPDGSVDEDSVTALYQPGEGLNCQGEPFIPPPDCDFDERAIDTNADRYTDSCVFVDPPACDFDQVLVDTNDNGNPDTCEGADPPNCGPDEIAVDTNGNGVLDACEPAPTPEPTPTADPPNPDPSATPTPNPTVDPSATPVPNPET
ncbi:MAG: VanW family protein [Acidimicrobiales bacterium]